MTGFRYEPGTMHAASAIPDHNTRILVAGSAAGDFVTAGVEARYITTTSGEVAAGTYVFDGLESPLVLIKPAGSDPADAVQVPHVDLTHDHPLKQAWGWAEHWWSQATAIAAPQYPVNTTACTADTGAEVMLTARRFNNGQWIYTCFVDGTSKRYAEGNLRPATSSGDPLTWVADAPADVDIFSATLTRAKIKGRFATTLFSYGATRTTFRPYQFKPVMKLLETGKNRLLIADEVGLGKTIEAGLIWTELEARREANRVMIVCPSGLVSKWESEMWERFGQEAEILRRKDLEKFASRHREGRLPARFRYIISNETLRTWEGLEELALNPPRVDLVIVDEAHSMRNTTKTNDMGHAISTWAETLVFLTATPINLHQRDLFNLLDILVPEEIRTAEELEEQLEPNRVLNLVGRVISQPNSTAGERTAPLTELADLRYGRVVTHMPEFAELLAILRRPAFSAADTVEARRLLAKLNTIGGIVTRTKKTDVIEDKPIRESSWVNVSWTVEEHEFYGEYLAWCQARAEAVGMPLNFAMQMPLRLASACLPMARRSVLEWSPGRVLIDDEDESEENTVGANRSNSIPPHAALLTAAERLAPRVDSKFDQLEPVLKDLRDQGKQALLFTFSRQAIRYLQHRLGADWRIAVLHGDVDRAERYKIMRAFRDGEYDLVIASKVASEGLDFEFCSAVINYDLPWNPMEVEQRIGRIDRIGQREKKILITSFRNDDTIDESIIGRVLERIEIFKNSIGDLEPIINENAAAIVKAIDFSLTNEQREAQLDQFAKAVEENKAAAKDYSENATALVVGADVDVDGLEETVKREGSYVGPEELALLVRDWCRIDDAPAPVVDAKRSSLRLRGTTQLAERVRRLADAGTRVRSEIESLEAQLRAGDEVFVGLDPDKTTLGTIDLLTTSHPLALAAADVPGSREVRFSHVRVPQNDPTVRPGTYLVAFARAELGSASTSELWAAACTLDGVVDRGPVVHVLQAALAEAKLTTPHAMLPDIDLADLTQLCLDEIQTRQMREEQELRTRTVATREQRRQQLTGQHERKMASDRRRLQTNIERGNSRMLPVIRTGMDRAEQRHQAMLTELEAEAPPVVSIEPVAVAVVEVAK